MAVAVLDTLLFGPGQPRWQRSTVDQIDEQPGRRAWTFLFTLLRDECFRFHIAEIEKLSPQELYWEIESYAPC